MPPDIAASREGSIYRVHQGDARDTAAFLDSVLGNDKLTTTITSPPYAWLKNYRVSAQIGYGQDLVAYLDDCGKIFAALAERTYADGSLWIIADSLVDQSAPVSRLIPLPFVLAEAAAEFGWVLRDVITWRRDKGMPWSGRGRLRNAFEYVLHLVLSDDFTYHLSELRDPTEANRWWVRFPERYHPAGPVKTNVWDIPIPTQGAWSTSFGGHSCPLPLELVDRIVRLSTDDGDIVFDPFAGIGSVVTQANRLGRRGLGLDINPDYVAAALPTPPSSPSGAGDTTSKAGLATPDLIMNLRALKRSRTLAEQLRRADATLPHVFTASVVPDPAAEQTNDRWTLGATTTLVAADSAPVRRRMERLANALLTRPPLSKFGITGPVRVVSPHQFVIEANRTSNRWWLYPRGRTWRYDTMLDRIRRADLAEWQTAAPRAPYVLATVPIWLEE